jgi:hypothetical protein
MEITEIMKSSKSDEVLCCWSSTPDGQFQLITHSSSSNTVSVFDDNFGLLKATSDRIVDAMSCFNGNLLLCSGAGVTVVTVSGEGELCDAFTESDVCDGEIGRKLHLMF